MERISGIYAIRNIETGAEYIGSSVNIAKRWSKHRLLLTRNQHFNPYLQNSWNKYGKGVFTFEVLEQTTDLNRRELYWIYQNNPSFNCKKAIERKEPNELGFYITEETRQRLSLAHMGQIPGNKGKPGRLHTEEEKKHFSEIFKGRIFTPEWRQKISDSKTGKPRTDTPWNKGKPQTDEVKRKISITKTGKPGHPHSEETRQKMSESKTRFYQNRKITNACAD